MSTTTTAAPLAPSPARPGHPSLMWRVAGVLGLAHIVLMLGGFALEGASVVHGTAPAKVLQTYAGVDLTRLQLSTYVESLAFLVLAPALVLLARLFATRTDGSSTEAGRIALGSFTALGIAYIGSTMAIGFTPLLAGTYAAHHGVDPGALALVNDLRNYGFELQVALSAAFALALGVAAVAHRLYTWWVGYGGLALGVVGLAAIPWVYNGVSFFWLVWWVGLCVACLRGGPGRRRDEDPSKA